MMFEWVLIAGAILWWINGRQERPTTDASRSAERILEERLARGEIDADEYHARRRAIGER